MKRTAEAAFNDGAKPSKLQKIVDNIVSYFLSPVTRITAAVENIESPEINSGSLAILPLELFPKYIGQFIPAYSFIGDNSILGVSKQWKSYFSHPNFWDKKERLAILASAHGSYANPLSDDPLFFLSDHSRYQHFSLAEIYSVASSHLGLASTLLTDFTLNCNHILILGQHHLSLAQLLLDRYLPQPWTNLYPDEPLYVTISSGGMNIHELLLSLCEKKSAIAAGLLTQSKYKQLFTKHTLICLMLKHPELISLIAGDSDYSFSFYDYSSIVGPTPSERKIMLMLQFLGQKAEPNALKAHVASQYFGFVLARADKSYAIKLLKDREWHQLLTRQSIITIILSHSSLIDEYLFGNEQQNFPFTEMEAVTLTIHKAFIENNLASLINAPIKIDWFTFCKKSALLTEAIFEKWNVKKVLKSADLLLLFGLFHKKQLIVNAMLAEIINNENGLGYFEGCIHSDPTIIQSVNGVKTLLSTPAFIKKLTFDTLPILAQKSIHLTEYAQQNCLDNTLFPKSTTFLTAFANSFRAYQWEIDQEKIENCKRMFAQDLMLAKSIETQALDILKVKYPSRG